VCITGSGVRADQGQQTRSINKLRTTHQKTDAWITGCLAQST